MMKDFSGLALPPLFGEHILEAELEPGGVELGPGEVMLWLSIVVFEVWRSMGNHCSLQSHKKAVHSRLLSNHITNVTTKRIPVSKAEEMLL